MPRLKQFFSYFGSKVGNAHRYPAPIYGTIIEPFAGSAGYACNYPDQQVKLYDKNETVVMVWKYLIRATRLDILSLPLDPEDIGICSPEESAFIRFWWGRCIASPCISPVAWMRSNLYLHSFWSKQTRSRIAGQVEAIKHWTCEQASYETIGNQEATWFIDPPYQNHGQRYPNGTRNMNYTHLADWVRERQGQYITCEARGATWADFEPIYSYKTVKYAKQRRSIEEMIWCHPPREIIQERLPLQA